MLSYDRIFCTKCVFDKLTSNWLKRQCFFGISIVLVVAVLELVYTSNKYSKFIISHELYSHFIFFGRIFGNASCSSLLFFANHWGWGEW